MFNKHVYLQLVYDFLCTNYCVITEIIFSIMYEFYPVLYTSEARQKYSVSSKKHVYYGVVFFLSKYSNTI